jgi:hypothetical protein
MTINTISLQELKVKKILLVEHLTVDKIRKRGDRYD